MSDELRESLESVGATWQPLEPDPAEEWVLASGRVGWVRADLLREADELLAALERLGARRDALQNELDITLADARKEGAEEGARAASLVLSELASYRLELASAAASAAMEIAVGVVGDSVVANDAALEAFAAKALGQLDTFDALAVEVAPEMVGPISAVVADVPVVANADLAVTDVRVLLPGGKREFRLAEALQHLHPAVRASIEGADD